MIFSQQLLLSDQQDITADANSTNIIDLGVQGTPIGDSAALTRDVGVGASPCLLVQVTEDFNNLTNITVKLINSTTADLSSGNFELARTTLSLANLVAGASMPVQFIPTGATRRYLGIQYDVTGTAPTTGKFTAGIVAGVQNGH